MAWGAKEPEKTFEEQFGMTREAFDARMKEADEARAKVTELESKVAGIDDLRSQLEALKAPKTEPKQNEPTNWYENPDLAMNERMAPVVQHTLNTNARLEEMSARQRFDRDFKRWGSEIEGLIKQHPHLADKGNPTFYENIVNIVRGRHAQEIEESAAKGQFYFTEQPGGGAAGGSSESPESKLSASELSSAKRLGMTPAEFLKNQEYVFNRYGHTKGGQHVN
jgi:hypothetical protein